MSDFDTEGFLSQEAQKIKEAAHQKFPALYVHAYAVNRVAQRMKHLFKANNADGQQTISVVVFIKILNDFQSIIILSEKGLRLQVEVLLRSMLEAVFRLKLLCEEKEFYQEYILQDTVQRNKLVNVAHNNPHEIFKATRKMADEAFVQQIKEEIEKYSLKEHKTMELARRAGLLELYDSVYRITSGPAHTSIRALNDYVKSDQQGHINEFFPGPLLDFDTEVDTAINLLVVSLESLRKLFGLPEDQELENLVKKIIADRVDKTPSTERRKANQK